MSNNYELSNFQWDKGNIQHVLTNDRGITRSDILEVFNSEESKFFEDIVHSSLKQKFTRRFEKRYYVVGQTINGIFLFIGFSIRNEKIRVHIARRMHRKEISLYFKNHE